MPVLNIEGRKIRVDDSFSALSPEQKNATVEEIVRTMNIVPTGQEQPQAVESDQSKSVRDELAAASQSLSGKNDGAMRSVDSFMRGAADTATFGLADEAAAIGKSTSPFNQDGVMDTISATANTLNPITNMTQQITQLLFPNEKTKSALREERAFQTQRDDVDPYASTAGRVAGALTSGVGLTKAGAPFMATLPSTASLGAKTAQAIKSGALYSGLYGVGTGTDAGDRVAEGAKGALTGAALGAVIPTAAAAVGAVTKPFTDAVKGYMRPEAFANQKIAERLADAGTDAGQAANKMAKQPGLSLADVAGKPAQNLLKTATNIPGKAQARVAVQLAQRAMQQGDRIKTVVKNTFADPDGYLAAKDDIASTAEKLAKPLYKKAYETPIPFTKNLEELLQTPAVKRALGKAQEKMANSQEEFKQLFANIADDGTVTIKRVPDTQGWDYIKRAMDDEIGALRRTGAKDDVRILTGLKNKILTEVDDANPFFAQARKVWSGQAALDDALEAGREAMSQSPEATRRMMAGMSQAEKESFKIGMAEWIRKEVDRTGFTHNAILKFFSNRGQLQNLRAAFDDDKQFKAFREAIFAEARKRSTYNTVTGNSSTAKQLADMADAGGMRDTVDFVGRAVTQGPVSATLQFIGSSMKRLGGFTPRVADEVAKKLMATNPQTVRQITTELQRIESAAISSDQKRQLVQKLIIPMISEQATMSRQ